MRDRPSAWVAWRRSPSINRAVALTIALYAGLAIWQEWRARGDAKAFCSAHAHGVPIPIDPDSLAARQRADRQRYRSLFVIDWKPDAAPAPAGDGALVAVFLGAFPFGRETCMFRLAQGRVVGSRLVYGSDDHAYCGGDLRPIPDCPPSQ